MKGLVGRPQERLKQGGFEQEKAGNRTETKSQLPTNFVKFGTSQGWNVLG